VRSELEKAVRRKSRQRRSVIEKYAGRCYLCGVETEVDVTAAASPRYATIDHIIPLSKGGEDVADNRALACRACNEKKADIVPQ